MGTGPFAVPSFQALLKSPNQVIALVTRPIADPGRRKDSANPMRDAAVAANIAVQSPANVNDSDFVAWLREQHADLFVVCDYGQILSAECLSTARLGGINLHGSLLPKYRGAAPVQWAVYHGDPVTGVSVIHMTPRLDAGPILAKLETPIGPDETTESLEPRLAALGPKTVLTSLELLDGWDGVSELGERQDTTHATLAPRLRKEQGLIDWSKSADQIRNQIRAFNPWPGSYTNIPRDHGEPLRIIVHQSEIVVWPPGAQPGTVLDSSSSQLVVACGVQALGLLSVQPAGKRLMAIAEFLRGNPIVPSSQLH